jgi:PBP1b-binding outer membrane lipoprotein LpoB
LYFNIIVLSFFDFVEVFVLFLQFQEKGMKKSISVLVIGIMALALAAGCSSAPVSRVDAGAQIDLSGRFNDTDARLVATSLINDALASGRIDDYIKKFEASHNGDHPTVIMSRFRNESKERMDEVQNLLGRMMRTSIINSGKLEFVEGGDARADLRAERQDQQGNASEKTASALGNETGANFMLQGTVDMVADEAVVGGKKVAVNAYFVSASITDVEKNTILWEGENNEIKKLITQNSKKL